MMDEEEAKRLAEAAVSRMSSTKKPLPESPKKGSVVAEKKTPTQKVVGKAMARAGLGEDAKSKFMAGKGANASKSISDSIVDGFTHFTGGGFEAGDVSPVLDAKGMISTGNPGEILTNLVLGGLDTIQNRDERTGEVSGINTLATAGLDSLLIGTANTTTAMAEQTMTGDYDAPLADTIAKKALEQEEIRAANPGYAIAGDIAGSVVAGTKLAKGGMAVINKLTPSFGKLLTSSGVARVLGGATAGAGQTAVYRLNKGGSLQEAAVEAGLAFLGGSVLGGVIGGGKGLVNLFRPIKVDDGIRNDVGTALLRVINAESIGKTGKPVTAVEVQKQLEALGPDATLLDAYPSLKELASSIMRNEGDEGAGVALREVLSTRADFMESFMDPQGGLAQVLNAQAVRGEAAFSAATDELFSSLQPKINNVLQGVSGVRQNTKQMLQDIPKLFGDKARWTGGQSDLLHNIFAMIKERGARAVTKKGAKPTEMTVEQLWDMKKELSTALSKRYLKVAAAERPVSLDKQGVRDLAIVNDYLDQQLTRLAPGLEPLIKTYGVAAQTKLAYKTGLKMFKPSTSVDDIVTFFAGHKSQSEQMGYIEGVKAAIYKKLDIADLTPEKLEAFLVNNNVTMNKLKAVIGDDATKAVFDAASAVATKAKTANDLLKVAPKVLETIQNNIGADAANLATAVGSAAGLFGSAAGRGGVMGLVKRIANPDAAKAPARREVASEVLSAQGPAAAAAVDSMSQLMSGNPTLSQLKSLVSSAGRAAGIGGAIPRSDDTDGQLP